MWSGHPPQDQLAKAVAKVMAFAAGTRKRLELGMARNKLNLDIILIEGFHQADFAVEAIHLIVQLGIPERLAQIEDFRGCGAGFFRPSDVAREHIDRMSQFRIFHGFFGQFQPARAPIIAGNEFHRSEVRFIELLAKFDEPIWMLVSATFVLAAHASVIVEVP